MTPPTLTGPGAPVVDFDGATLVLHYATIADYGARIHADHAEVETLPGARIVSSCVDETPIYGLGAGSGAVHCTYLLAPAAPPAKPITESPKPRR